MNDQQHNRRRFLLHAATALGALPLLGQLSVRRAHAAAKPLPTSNAQAKALNYAEDAAKVTHSMFKAGSTCENCQFYTADNQGCTIFPGYSVAPKGWCSAWALKK